ncbi:MAG TPA: hypothetical protein VEK33_25165 [Terriglobales bacterium]|nr:hypothetical protein [Terriglobales bacterium]
MTFLVSSRRRQFSAFRMFSLFLVQFASISLLAQSGSVYWVSTTGSDSNPGTVAAPWLTIQHAANTVTAGATVNVMGGVSVYNAYVSFPNSGTATAPITFQSYPVLVGTTLQPAVIDGTGLTVSGTQGLITISGARSYITVQGFEIRNLSTTSKSAVPCGVWITGSGTGVQILNNLIHNIDAPGTGNGCGLFAYGTSQTPITGLVVSGNELYDLQTGESESLTLNGNVTHFQVTNNVIHDNYNIGIDIIGYEGTGPVGYDQASYGAVSGNTVYNISGIVNTGEGEEFDADGLYCDGCGYVTFERNVVFQADYGIETTSENQVCQATGTEWSGTPTNTGNNTENPAKGGYPCYGMYATVRNNLFYYENACGNSIGGYALASSKGGAGNGGGSSFHDVFVNNTLYDNGTQPGNSSEGTPSGDFQTQYQLGSAQNDYFENTIIYESASDPVPPDTSPGTSPNMWINSYVSCSSSYPCPPATLNWNLYGSVLGYAEGRSIEWAGNSSYTSFANYQATNGGEDANSLNANPIFDYLETSPSTPPNFTTDNASPAVGGGSTSLSCSVFWCDPNGSSPNSIYGSTDILGNPRTNPSTGAIDIGAYQNNGGPIANSLTVNLNSAASLLQGGQTTTLAVTVTAIPGGGGAPTGTVSLYNGQTMLEKATLMPTGVNTTAVTLPLSASQLTANNENTLTAVYSGNLVNPCCNPEYPPGGSQTPIAWYPSETSAAIIVTECSGSGMYSPANNATLTGATQVFNWCIIPGATAYWVDIGSTQGGNNYYSSGNLGLVYSLNDNNGELPTNGSTVYVTLYALINGSWSPNYYTYTAFNAGAETAVMASPTPGSMLSGSTVTFSWNAGTASPQEYWLDIGSSAGGNNYYSSGNLGSALSATVSGLPTNGTTVYAALYTLVSGTWTPNPYTYTAFSVSAEQGVLTTPTPGSTLTSGTVTFDWTAGSPGPYSYWVDIGNTAGGNNYYSSGNLGNVTTTTVSGLPTNGSTVYVTLYTLIGGQWYGSEYTYTALNATSGLAAMQTPMPGTTISGTTQTFTWSSDSQANAYWVDIGSTAGGNNIYSSGNLGTALSTTVYTLPANGSTIYVSLYSYVGGQWVNNPVTYTSGP